MIVIDKETDKTEIYVIRDPLLIKFNNEVFELNKWVSLTFKNCFQIHCFETKIKLFT